MSDLPLPKPVTREQGMQACNLQGDLRRTQADLDRLHNSDNEWINTWRNWRDSYDIFPDWLKDHEHSRALGAYEADQYTVALMASSWFDLSYDTVHAALDPAKSAADLHRAIDRLWPLTNICRSQTNTPRSQTGLKKTSDN
jgi:hypothetical protein